MIPAIQCFHKAVPWIILVIDVALVRFKTNFILLAVAVYALQRYIFIYNVLCRFGLTITYIGIIKK